MLYIIKDICISNNYTIIDFKEVRYNFEHRVGVLHVGCIGKKNQQRRGDKRRICAFAWVKKIKMVKIVSKNIWRISRIGNFGGFRVLRKFANISLNENFSKPKTVIMFLYLRSNINLFRENVNVYSVLFLTTNFWKSQNTFFSFFVGNYITQMKNICKKMESSLIAVVDSNILLN